MRGLGYAGRAGRAGRALDARGRRAASAASRPRSRGSRGGRCRASSVAPTSSWAPCRWASGTDLDAPGAPGRRAGPPTRAAWSACCLTASSTAAAKPAIAGVSMVPERMSRSWPPPCTSGVTSSSRRTTSAPTPYGPPTLCPVRVSASTPEAAKSTGTEPTACTASVCTGMPCSAAISTTSSTGCEGADLVVGPHHRDQGDRAGIALDGLAQRVDVEAARARRRAAARPRRPRARRASAAGRARRGARRRCEDPGAARVGGRAATRRGP